ncbi:uncharacterized protein LOC113216266 [Frankliniella occidentalis]|uniref:Uncharacterized protein LOC113216266 n=1 Tax=Frankliniella occidentalis TaxID=133901 RepID=A0A9C6X0E1_FRAOC|nr:uncharacterized protein LOC113216266 [Frankliniella occidentalis]
MHRDAQFAIVEFTKEKNQKESVPIEIVPMIWIHAKGKKTYWPSKPRITAKEMKALVEELTDPNSGDKEDWVAPPCKILRTSRTYDGACARLKRLRRQAVVSSSQSDREDDDEDDEDEEDEEEKKRYRKRRNTKQDSDNEDDSEGSGSNDELDSSLLSPGVFDDFDCSGVEKLGDESRRSRDSPLRIEEQPSRLLNSAHTSNRVSSVPPKSVQKSVQKSAPKSMQGKTSTPNKPKPSHSRRELSFVTPHRQGNFEHVVLKKLNTVTCLLEEILSRGRREAVLVPSATSLDLPITTLDNIAALDVELGDSCKQKNMQTFLCQFGGKNPSDFLHRCLPKLIDDKLCEKLNWSGLHREMAFKDSKHIISTLHGASRSLFNESTEAMVEGIIKLWFNKYKDRLEGRDH